MSVSHLVTLDYQGHAIDYQDDGWFNATQAASKYGKRPNDFLDLPSTREYVAALDESSTLITGKSGNWHRSKRGKVGGTWLHPKLGVRFAQWLDARFAVWCDEQIDNLIHSKQDWKQQRHASISGAKVMALMLKETRKSEGKETAGYHYSNEHLMINTLVTGERKGMNRDVCTVHELNALAEMQVRNSMLMGRGVKHVDRKMDLATVIKTLPVYTLLRPGRPITAEEAARNVTRAAANESAVGNDSK